MNQERLHGLGIITIEKEKLRGISDDQIIDEFNQMNKRRYKLSN